MIIMIMVIPYTGNLITPKNYYSLSVQLYELHGAEGVIWQLGFVSFCSGKMGFDALEVELINIKFGHWEREPGQDVGWKHTSNKP